MKILVIFRFTLQNRQKINIVSRSLKKALRTLQRLTKHPAIHLEIQLHFTLVPPRPGT